VLGRAEDCVPMDVLEIGDRLPRVRLSVTVCGAAPTEALLVTDANLLAGMTVDIVRMLQLPALLPSMLIVAVGYATDRVEDVIAARTRDLTPASMRGFDGSGGGPEFRELLRTEVLAKVRSHHPSVERFTYVGHSLGGLFGVTDLLAPDPMFDRYLISSPSLWWKRHALLNTRHAMPDRPVYFSIGSDETDDGRRREAVNLPDDHPMKPPAIYLDMVDDLRRFVALLDPVGRPPTVDIIDREFHSTVVPRAITQGLRTLFNTP
jgi:uncharacterized protein